MAGIHPTAMIAAGAELAEDVEIGPYCTVGQRVRLARGVRLISHVVVEGVTSLGEETVVYPFAVLGGPPQHLGHHGEPTELFIGPRNQIREHVTMHTGTVAGGGVTRVGAEGLFMVGSHVAHDCTVGDKVVMANNATLGGHVKVADFVFMGGLSAAHQHTRIGRYSFIGGLAPVTKDVIPFALVGNDAHLEGMNLVGLKRRGFGRDTIKDLRAAYRLLFADEGSFQERVEDVARVFAHSSQVMEVVDFIRADAARPLCMPKD
ncbi:MAG TPA: acyl-ACP--UDP-N-acetylglucosamine O-acyltransferase [Caulobacteraceae bacterium]|jgi:UDP-N-acetylglucosamine acyltransferase